MPDDLYVTLEELTGVIGDAAAAKLVAACGGERLYVPRRFRATSRVVQAIGADAADQLSRHICTGRGGLWLELPRGADGAVIQLRRRVARICDRPDLSIRLAAREAGVTMRAVRMRRAKTRAKRNGSQGTLL